jgi:hypothetical protein
LQTPEWISPPGCLPRTDQQVAEQLHGYSSPGMSWIWADYIRHPDDVKVIILRFRLEFGHQVSFEQYATDLRGLHIFSGFPRESA